MGLGQGMASAVVAAALWAVVPLMGFLNQPLAVAMANSLVSLARSRRRDCRSISQISE